MSKYNGEQALIRSFRPDKNALAFVKDGELIPTIDYDEVILTKPNELTDVFTYYLSGIGVRTVTVSYLDSCHEIFSSLEVVNL